MGISFRCECGTEGQVPDAALHQYVKCPACNQTSYVGSRHGPVVPVVHRPDRPRRSRHRALARALLVVACVAVAGGLAYGLIKEHRRSEGVYRPDTTEPQEIGEHTEPLAPKPGDPDARLVVRIHRELEADREYSQSYERLRAVLIDEYRSVEERRRALRTNATTSAGPEPHVAEAERRLRRREDEIHQLYVKWAAKIDHRVKTAVPEADLTLISHWVSKVYPEPTMDEVRAASARTE